MNDQDNQNPKLPQDLHALEASLDALGEVTRAGAPSELGKRISDEGIATITSPSRGHLRLAGTDADPARQTGLGQHWRMAASITLLLVAVIAAISQNQPFQSNGLIVENDADPETGIIDEDWIEFETEYASDSVWDDGVFESLTSELDDLELSFNTAWTLDENLNLNEGESL